VPEPAADHDDGARPSDDDAAGRLRAEREVVVALLEARTRALEGVFEAAADSNSDDEHDPEGQTIAYERSQLSAVVDAAQARLAEIDEALDRLEAGTYGVCEVCRQPIPVERMLARPTARTCVEHADSRPSDLPQTRFS
jgi:RNA polymerase-binding transcription factor DksA